MKTTVRYVRLSDQVWFNNKIPKSGHLKVQYLYFLTAYVLQILTDDTVYIVSYKASHDHQAKIICNAIILSAHIHT